MNHSWEIVNRVPHPSRNQDVLIWKKRERWNEIQPNPAVEYTTP